MMEACWVVFVDSNQKRVVAKNIQNLQQRVHLVVIFIAKFQQLACDFERNDKALINQFCYSLKNNVKILLLTMPKIGMLEGFITQAIAYDNQLFIRRQE